MAPHSKLGPSSADRWFACPGSINLIATLPPEAFKTNKYAAEGVVAHDIVEQYVTGKVDFLELTSRVGEVVMQEGFEVEITDEMLDGAVEYKDAIDERRKTLTKPIKVEEQAEVQVKATSAHEDVWGTADYVMFQRGGVLYVFDYKFGKGVVDVTENKQMLTYAVAVEDTWAGKAFNEVVLVVVQPRARHADGAVREYRLNTVELDRFRAELRLRATATKDSNAVREAGNWCKFCPALPYCPEARGKVQSAARMEFNAPLPAAVAVGKDGAKAVGATYAARLTPEQVAQALEYEDLVDAFFEAVRERALQELTKDANAVPGYKLVEGKTNRKWREDVDIAAAFALLGDKIWAEPKLKSPAQMEKIAGKPEVEKYTIKPEGKLTVAKLGDKREARTPAEQAKTAFDVLPAPATATIGEVDLGGFDGSVASQTELWPS